MINFCCIENLELEHLIKRFDEAIAHIKKEFGIEIIVSFFQTDHYFFIAENIKPFGI